MAVLDLWVAADESGIHDTAPWCLLMGFIGSPRVWTRVEEDWKAVLKEYGVSLFHSKRFFKRDSGGKRLDEYRDWPDDKAREFLAHLLDIVRHRQIRPVGGAVEVPVFNSYSHGERRFLSGAFYGRDYKPGKWVTSGAPSKPYYLALQHLLVEAVDEAKPGVTVHFLFDRQNVLEARAVQTFDETVLVIPEPRRRKLGRIAFAESLTEPSLQVADLLCNCWYSYLANPKERSWERRMAMDVLASKRKGIRMYNREGCELILSGLPEAVRNKMKNEKAQG